MKAKLKGAETGHSLLKRKSEALTKFVSSQRFCPLHNLRRTPPPWTGSCANKARFVSQALSR